MPSNGAIQLSFYVLVDGDENQAAHIEVTGGSSTSEAVSEVSLEGLDLVELSLALKTAVAVVGDLLQWRRASDLAEKAMSEADNSPDIPF